MLSNLIPSTAAMFLAFVMSTPALAASTAKAALKEVVTAGQKWQPDAVLTHVSALETKPDGKARTWLYTFYSPKQKKSAIVTARDMKVDVEPDVRNTSTDPIGEFIDSDKVMEAARKHGLKAGDSAALGLTMMGQATKQPRVLWSVVVMNAETILSWGLDSKDGSLTHKNETKLK
jgi:hypothetical protein